MASLSSKANRLEPHKWFAWFPVLATKEGPAGLTYHYVWLSKVTRVYLRVAGLGRWTYKL